MVEAAPWVHVFVNSQKYRAVYLPLRLHTHLNLCPPMIKPECSPVRPVNNFQQLSLHFNQYLFKTYISVLNKLLTCKYTEFPKFISFIEAHQYLELYLLKPDWTMYFSLQLDMWICLHTIIDVGMFWVVGMNMYEEHWFLGEEEQTRKCAYLSTTGRIGSHLK